MKIEKKHIIIAIVVAVAVYLLWRRGVFAKGVDNTGGSSSTSSSTSAIDPADTLEGVISASGMSRADAVSVRKFNTAVENSETLSWKAGIERNAADNGYTYWQQLALEALWNKYHSDSEGWASNTPWTVISAIQNM